MRIVYMGSPDFAVPALHRLVEWNEVEVVGVASNPDKRRGRGNKTSPTPVKEAALAHLLPTFDVESTRDPAFHQWLGTLKPDLLVVIAFRILPNEVLAIPQIGSINVHASLLPKFRGAAPIHHAVMQGESQTGLSSFFLNEGMDTGEIIAQTSCYIAENETTGEVYKRLMNMTPDFLQQSLTKIIKNEGPWLPQNHALASPAPKLFDEHCRIDWRNATQRLHNHIRGLSPFPGAYTKDTEGLRYTILKTSIPKEAPLVADAVAGSTLREAKKMLVATADGWLCIEEIKPSGKKSMSGFDLINGKPELQFTPHLED